MRKLLFWLCQAAILTIIFGTIYVTVHQSYRQSANDPQVSMVLGLANQLANGTDLQLSQVPKVDPSNSLTPFVIIYDDHGKITDSNVELNGKTPQLPDGVLDNVRRVGQERLTWQPAQGVRLAAVISHHSGKSPGFVLAARNLKEVEQREDMLTFEVGLAWLASLAVLGLSIYFKR